MNTLKRKLTAILLTFAMLFSLMPALPQAAEAAQKTTAGQYVTMEYKEVGAGVLEPNSIVVNVFIEGRETAVETLTVNDAGITDNNITINVNGSDYEIAGRTGVSMDASGASLDVPPWNLNMDLNEFSTTWTSGHGSTLTINLTLREPVGTATEENGHYEGTATVEFRAYDEQIFKMLYLAGNEVDVDTTIDSVSINFKETFGEGASYGLTDINREEDYYSGTLSNASGKAIPANIESLTIQYNGGTVNIPAKDLCLNYHAGIPGTDNYYLIESNNDNVHIVYFYNEADSNTGNNYTLYAIRFVNDGESVGNEMPEDPTYNETILNQYKFVNWELESWTGDRETGEAFLPSTIVDSDINVFAHKVSSDKGGTQIYILNNQSQFLNRIAEKYNEENGTSIDASDIRITDQDGFGISVYEYGGRATTPRYADSGWADHNSYYDVRNYDAEDGTSGETYNQKVAFDQVAGIRVEFKTNGDETVKNVEIPVGNNAGDLAKLMDNGDNVLQLYVVQEDQVVSGGSEDPDPEPQPPAAPTEDELNALIDVTVDCESNEAHELKTYPDLLANSYTPGNVTANANGTYSYSLTVYNGAYVEKYNNEYVNGHNETGETSAVVELVNDGNGWKLADGSATMVIPFLVTCDSGSQPVTGGTISGFEKDLIAGLDEKAAAEEAGVDVENYYIPEKANQTVTIPYDGEVTLLYSITVTGSAEDGKFVEFFINDEGATLIDTKSGVSTVKDQPGVFNGKLRGENASITFYVSKTFNADQLTEIGDKTYLVNEASIKVKGEGEIGTEENIDEKVPAVESEKPDDPTYEDMKEPVVNGAVKIDCINPLVQHEDPTYGLIEGSYTLPADGVVGDETNGFTYTITVSPDKYVETYNTNTHSSHTLVDGQSAKTITYKYDNGDWVVADTTALPLVYEVNCDATPDQYITGFDKELVSTAEAAEAAVGTSEGYAFPNGQEIVLVPNGGEVTLLYSITVEGKPGTAFVIEDQGAELVKGDVDDTRGDNLFYGHLPTGEKSLTFYVAKTFKAADITDGKLTNHATIKIDKEDGEEGAIDPDVNPDVDEVVDAEEEPALPTEEWLEENFDVELDCKSNVGHENQTYDLVYKDGMLGTLTRDDAGNYTITMTVAGADYLEKFNEASGNVDHVVDGDETKTITLTYNNGWTAPENSSPIEFDVKCSGTGNFDINGIAKDLVAGQTDKDTAITNGVENLDSFTIPEADETVIIPAGESVTLLYSITVTGNDKKDVKFVVTDEGTTLVPSSAAVEQKDDGTYTGTIPAGGSVTFYVSKEFTGANINEEDKLVNTASVDGADEETTVDPDDKVDETVPAEDGPALPDQDAMNALLDVVLDCASNVGHADGTYKDLLENSYDFGDVTHNDEGAYSVGVTIDSDKYIADYSNNVVKVAHEIQDETQATKTVTLTYDKDQGNWTTTGSPVEFLIVCKGVNWDISNIEKDLVTEATLGAAKANGVSDDALKNIIVPEDMDDTVIIPEDGSVTLLYAITVSGKAGIAFSVEDPGTTLVKSSANVSVDENADVATYTGSIPENGIVTFYVSKNFTVDNITENGQLVNSATVAGDDGTTVNPGTEDDPANKDDEAIAGEEEDNRPTPPPYIPGGDDDDNPGDNDGPSGLNTEDHFSYVVGYEDGMVKPQRSITRAEVATIFYRLLEDDVRDDYDTTRNNFSDVTSDSWYNQTVSTLASMGILKGYEDGTFRPNASITRAEFAAIATRFFEETGATYEPGTFTDVTGSEWFAGAIMDAVNLGLIGGYEDGTVRPNNNITRAEACAIVNRTLGRVPDADHLLPADEMTTWPDNPSSAWFYADMQEATNGHEYEWITEDGNKIEEWTDILDKDWNDR